MNFQKLMLPVAGVALVALAWQGYGGAGVALVVGGIVFWLLLHFTRLMTVLKRAAQQPVGFVGSAVMLNARLKPGVTLMHVIAMTRALGAQQSPPGDQPERFRWTDAGSSYVDCEFVGGRLTRWTLVRPDVPPDGQAD